MPQSMAFFPSSTPARRTLVKYFNVEHKSIVDNPNWVKKHVIDAQSEKVTHFKSSTRDSDCNRANLGPYHEAKDVYNEPQARLCHVV